MNIRILIPALAALFLCRCAGTGFRTAGEELYSPRFAEGFSIERMGGGTLLTVKDPWQGASGRNFEIFLSGDGEGPPDNFSGVAVQTPLRSVVCMSSSHIAFIDALGEVESIKGVSGLRYVSNETVRSGNVADVGSDASVNYELIARLNPDLVLVYGVGGESSVTGGKLDELGISIAYIGDYLESTPLGRAEWILFFGELFGRRTEAEELFGSVCERYEAVRALAESVDVRPEVMLNAPWRDTWFVPGDRSYMVALVNDAGGEYVCRGEESRQSRPLGLENAFIAASRAQVWLNPNEYTSVAELLRDNPRFGSVPSVVSGEVYNNNARVTQAGGSDFWESAVIRPDAVLSDLIRILHPELLPGHELYYYRRL